MMKRRNSCFAGIAAAALAMLCVSCLHVPGKWVNAYGITQAHGVHALSIGPLSYLMVASTVFGNDSRKPVFGEAQAATNHDGTSIAIFPSARLRHHGFSDRNAQVLASHLAKTLESLSRHANRRLPVDRLNIYLVDHTTRLERSTRSLSLSRSHDASFFLAYAPEQPDQSTRTLSKIVSHELFHVLVNLPSFHGQPKDLDEQAANAMMHCVEIDVFGSTSAPKRITNVRRNLSGDTTPTGVSLMASYGADPALDAIFADKKIIDRSEAGSLRALCLLRARQLLDGRR